MAGLARRDSRGDGGHRDLQHARLSRADGARGVHPGPGVQRRACQERPGAENGSRRRRLAGHLLECGLLAGSFIPPAEIKAARDVFRYRTKVAQQRVSEIARLGNVLQDAGIKLDSVASSIATKSGRAMIEALIDGERRGPVLADLAKGKMRSKIPDLSMALEGRFGDHHALMCRLHLDHIDHLEAMIARLDAQIEAMMVPFAPSGTCSPPSPGSASSPPPG